MREPDPAPASSPADRRQRRGRCAAWKDREPKRPWTSTNELPALTTAGSWTFYLGALRRRRKRGLRVRDDQLRSARGTEAGADAGRLGLPERCRKNHTIAPIQRQCKQRQQRRTRAIAGERRDSPPSRPESSSMRRRVPDRVDRAAAERRGRSAARRRKRATHPRAAAAVISLTRKNSPPGQHPRALLQQPERRERARRCRAPARSADSRCRFCSAPEAVEEHDRLRRLASDRERDDDEQAPPVGRARVARHVASRDPS